MRKLSTEEQQVVFGGYVWFCRDCGYISHDHWFRNTAADMARKHEKNHPGHRTTVK